MNSAPKSDPKSPREGMSDTHDAAWEAIRKVHPWLPRSREGWHQHKNGGGWVQDTATVDDTARVCGKARVCGEALVCGEAQVYDKARVCGEARVYGKARVCGEAQVYDKARVCGEARVCDEARICGKVAEHRERGQGSEVKQQ